MFKQIVTKIAASLVFSLVLATGVQAEQYVTRFHGREVVVHTNPIPVILHRLVPPNYGRHITVRELQTGRVNPFANGIIPPVSSSTPSNVRPGIGPETRTAR